jgi:hypothetical protein
MMQRVAYLYINPKASKETADFFAQQFSAMTVRVSAVYVQEATGGFDEGPSVADYTAALLDETGELHLFEPTLPAALGG